MALRKLTAQQVRELAQSSLLACGASHLQASAIADMLRAAEEDGCSSHGLFRLPAFLEGCAGGRVDARAVPVVSNPLPAVVRVERFKKARAAEPQRLGLWQHACLSRGLVRCDVCDLDAHYVRAFIAYSHQRLWAAAVED